MPNGVPDLTPEISLDWKPGKSNWVDAVGGLPKYIESIASSLVTKRGISRSRAIAIAVNMVKKMATTGRATNLKGNPKVSPAVRSAAIAAVADWERKKAQARAMKKG